MKKYSLYCVLLYFLKVAELQSLQSIPPENETGVCSCQFKPPSSSGSSDLLMPHHSNVMYNLFTRFARGGHGIPIKQGDAASLANSGFNPALPLTIIVHGFQESPRDTTWIYLMKDALLEKENINIIIVDWSMMSKSVILTLVARYAKYTGKLVAGFLHFLKDSYPGFNGRQIHFIGFSFGAHISGIAGHLFPGVARITALDPAAPAFECIPDSQRLDRTDAAFVHVIHSSSGCFYRGHAGYRFPIGHQDFYPNGGGKQPGCNNLFLDALVYVFTLNNPFLCHHHRAVLYYIESIRAKEIAYGYLCPSYDTFKLGGCLGNTKGAIGYHATPGPEGTFFLSTQSKSSFLSKHLLVQVHVGTGGNQIAQGQFSLQSINRQGEAQTVSIIRSDQRLARSDQVYSTMITIPLESSPEGMQFALRYDSAGVRQIPGAAHDYLDILQIRAIDPVTKTSYCISPRETLRISTPYYVKARPGPC